MSTGVQLSARQALSISGVVLAVVVLAPPIGSCARDDDWAEALQFAVLFIAAPALFVAGAPWRAIGLYKSAVKLADGRRRHPRLIRSGALVASALVIAALWRTPAFVDSLHSHRFVLVPEAVSLFLGGTVVWLECVASAPLVPRASRRARIVIAATSMWVAWVLSYLVAMSSNDWYPAYPHVRGHGLSVAADQQVASGVIWTIAAISFIPVIFWNIIQWMRTEEDPDEELRRFVRDERRRTVPPPLS